MSVGCVHFDYIIHRRSALSLDESWVSPVFVNYCKALQVESLFQISCIGVWGGGGARPVCIALHHDPQKPCSQQTATYMLALRLYKPIISGEYILNKDSNQDTVCFYCSIVGDKSSETISVKANY
jgi:hypothetical protein